MLTDATGLRGFEVRNALVERADVIWSVVDGGLSALGRQRGRRQTGRPADLGRVELEGQTVVKTLVVAR